MLSQLKHDDSREEIFTILHQPSTYSTFGNAEKTENVLFWFFDFTGPLQDFELLHISHQSPRSRKRREHKQEARTKAGRYG